MGVSLERVQCKFASIIEDLCSEPLILSQFAVWVDLKMAEYKAKGAMSLECSGDKPEPSWMKGVIPPATSSQTRPPVTEHTAISSRKGIGAHMEIPHTAKLTSFSSSANQLSHSTSCEDRLSPEVGIIKEEPPSPSTEGYPLLLHSDTASHTMLSCKHLSDDTHDHSTSSEHEQIFPSASHEHMTQGSDSPANQSLLSIIGEDGAPIAEPQDVTESDQPPPFGSSSDMGPSTSECDQDWTVQSMSALDNSNADFTNSQEDASNSECFGDKTEPSWMKGVIPPATSSQARPPITEHAAISSRKGIGAHMEVPHTAKHTSFSSSANQLSHSTSCEDRLSPKVGIIKEEPPSPSTEAYPLSLHANTASHTMSSRKRLSDDTQDRSASSKHKRTLPSASQEHMTQGSDSPANQSLLSIIGEDGAPIAEPQDVTESDQPLPFGSSSDMGPSTSECDQDWTVQSMSALDNSNADFTNSQEDASNSVPEYAFIKFVRDGKTLQLKSRDLKGAAPVKVNAIVLAPWEGKLLSAVVLGLSDNPTVLTEVERNFTSSLRQKGKAHSQLHPVRPVKRKTSHLLNRTQAILDPITPYTPLSDALSSLTHPSLAQIPADGNSSRGCSADILPALDGVHQCLDAGMNQRHTVLRQTRRLVTMCTMGTQTDSNPTAIPFTWPTLIPQPSPISDSRHIPSPFPDSAPVQSPFPDSAHVQSPIPDSAHVQSPIRDSAPVQSPIPDSAPVQSPIPDSAPVQSPIPDSAPVQSPIPDSAPVQSPIPDSTPIQEPTPALILDEGLLPPTATCTPLLLPESMPSFTDRRLWQLRPHQLEIVTEERLRDLVSSLKFHEHSTVSDGLDLSVDKLASLRRRSHGPGHLAKNIVYHGFTLGELYNRNAFGKNHTAGQHKGALNAKKMEQLMNFVRLHFQEENLERTVTKSINSSLRYLWRKLSHPWLDLSAIGRC